MKTLAAFLAGLILATAGIAGASTQGWSLIHEQRQDVKLAQVRAVAKQNYIRSTYNEFRLNLIDCNGNNACMRRVTLAYYYSEEWPGWEMAGR